MAPICVAAGDPFIPAGDKDELWVFLQSAPPLLLKIKSQLYGLRAQVSLTRMPAPAHRAGFVAHWGRPWRVGQGVLRHAHAHLLIFVLCVRKNVLRIHFQPAPLVRTGGSNPVIGHRTAKGKESKHFRVLDELLVGQQERLAFPEEPQLFPQPRLVEVAPKLVCDCPRITKWSDEGNARRTHALLPHRRVFAAQCLVFILPGKWRVGGVEEDDIDPGVGQHAGMLANDERVGVQVITQFRLSPIRGRPVFWPMNNTVALRRQSFRIVIGAVGVWQVPRPIEDSHPPVLSRRTALIETWQRTPRSIRGHPGIGENVRARIRFGVVFVRSHRPAKGNCQQKG